MKKERTNLDEQQKQCKTQWEQIQGDLRKNILKNNILLFCSSHIHIHVGICQNLSVSIKIHWSLDTQITFRDCHMHFFIFPTTFLQTAVNVNSHLSLLFLP